MSRVPDPQVTVSVHESGIQVRAAEGMDTYQIKALLMSGIEVMIENEVRARLEQKDKPEPSRIIRVGMN